MRALPRAMVAVEAVARVFDTCALSARICRWPVGDPLRAGFGYCGDAVSGRGSYCEPHHRIACPPGLQVGRDREGRGARGRGGGAGGRQAIGS